MNEHRLWTASITPFSPEGHIDYVTWENLLRRQEDAGNGILLLGSTGEGLLLSRQEKQEALLWALSLGLSVRLAVSVPSYSMDETLSWLHFCNNLPLAGYLIPSPLYTKPGIYGQIAWFEALLEVSTHPVMLYNAPSRTGVALYPEVVAALYQHPRFSSVKDSGGSLEKFQAYRKINDTIKIYCGDDPLMCAMQEQGAYGLVSMIANVWPNWTRNFLNQSMQNSLLSQLWQDCTHHILSCGTNPLPVKALSQDLGLIPCDYVRRPLSLRDLHNRSSLKQYHEKMQQQLGSVDIF